MVEWNRADVVVKHMSFDDSVEEVRADGPEIPVDRRGSTSGEVPCLRLIMRQRRIGMLKVGDCHFRRISECPNIIKACHFW